MSGSKSCILLGPLTQWHLLKFIDKIHLRQVLCLGQLGKNKCQVGDRFTIEYYPGSQMTTVKTEAVSVIHFVFCKLVTCQCALSVKFPCIFVLLRLFLRLDFLFQLF